MTNTEICCPKCGSNQITADKKGFSGKKAVVGAILTGGVGILAGTIGSNKVKITCLACGKEFKPGEGKTNTIPENKPIKLISTCSNYSLLGAVDQRIVTLCEHNGILSAIKYYKDLKDLDFKTAKDYVDKLVLENNVKVKTVVETGGCFIATACYENYDSLQVLVLRKYRDERLLNTFWGSLFVKFYYSVSPFFAELIAKSDLLKTTIRKYFLDPIVTNLQRQNDNKKME